jgi:hypothetical protein
MRVANKQHRILKIIQINSRHGGHPAQTLAGVFRIVTVVDRAKAGIEQTRHQLWRQAGRLWRAGKADNTSFATGVAISQQRHSSVKSIELNQAI